jgi:hypothetical protein
MDCGSRMASITTSLYKYSNFVLSKSQIHNF